MASGIQPVCDDKRHLVCLPYSEDNLHAMAKELGLKWCWFHRAEHRHYDIPKRRLEEIKAKCVVVPTRTIIAIAKGEVTAL